jgi:hypothetical protein
MRARIQFAAAFAQLEEAMLNVGRASACLIIGVALAACAGGSTLPAPSAASLAPSVETRPTPAASAVGSATPASADPGAGSSAAAVPTPFTSTTYGYSLTLPAGWTAIQATKAWDGTGAPFHDVPEADQFIGPGAASAWFFGAPTKKDLQARVKESIAANAAGHGNTCPPVPEIKDPIEIGGEPGTLLGFNCGILINSAITVHDGVAYLFGMRDPSVHAATDPTDRVTFVELLKSVDFPE